MKLTGPYYRIAHSQDSLYVPAAFLTSMRIVAGKLAECARLQPQSFESYVEAVDGNVTGRLFPSEADGWHVQIRLSHNGLSLPHWMTVAELTELRDVLHEHNFPGEAEWLP